MSQSTDGDGGSLGPIWLGVGSARPQPRVKQNAMFGHVADAFDEKSIFKIGQGRRDRLAETNDQTSPVTAAAAGPPPPAAAAADDVHTVSTDNNSSLQLANEVEKTRQTTLPVRLSQCSLQTRLYTCS